MCFEIMKAEVLVYVPGRGRGTADKNWQRWQCQAPVTHCLAGLTGVREGWAPETQPSDPHPWMLVAVALPPLGSTALESQGHHGI